MIRVTKAEQARLTKRHYVRFWGRKRMCRPVFVPAALGDGGKLLAVGPLNTRPHYYLIRVDSSWAESNWHESPTIGDNIDEICEAIEEYVGTWRWEDDRGRERHDPWPAFDDDAGVLWWDATSALKRKAA